MKQLKKLNCFVLKSTKRSSFLHQLVFFKASIKDFSFFQACLTVGPNVLEERK